MPVVPSAQVTDGFIDGLNQRAGPRDVRFENLAVRLESGDFFELSLGQDFVDALQLKAQLPVKEDLLERQQLRLLIEPVAVGPIVGRFQQTRFIVKMKREQVNTRHRRQFLDRVSNRFVSSDMTNHARNCEYSQG